MAKYILGEGKQQFTKKPNLCRSYELGFKPGDLIVAYEKGFHVVEKIEPRFLPVIEAVFNNHYKVYEKLGLRPGDEFAALIHYRRLFRFGSFVHVPKSPILSCDASYVKKVTEEDLTNELVRISTGIRSLLMYNEERLWNKNP